MCKEDDRYRSQDIHNIFATAHDEYMKEAFEVYAFDYIVKPFSTKRVHETLDRIMKLSQGHNAPVIR